VQSFQQVENSAGSSFVQVARRFVGKQQTGTGDQSPRERNALLLAAREFARPMLAAILQVNLS
jgi:hypothetical protein